MDSAGRAMRILRSTRSGEVEAASAAIAAPRALSLRFGALRMDSRQGLPSAFECPLDGTRNQARRTVEGGERHGVRYHCLHASEGA
jgi:hypothetical protein